MDKKKIDFIISLTGNEIIKLVLGMDINMECIVKDIEFKIKLVCPLLESNSDIEIKEGK